MKRKKSGIIAGVILLVFVISSIILGVLIFQDDYAERYEITPTADLNSLTERLVISIVSGQELQISDQEINALISEFVNTIPEQENNKVKLLKMVMEIQEDNRVFFYLPIEVFNKKIGLTLWTSFQFEPESNRLLFTVEEAYAGHLPISPKYGLLFLKDYLPQGITTEENMFILDPFVCSPKIKELAEGKLNLGNIRIEDESFFIQIEGAENLIWEYVKNQWEMVKEQLTK